jgi:hypothetical protein
MKYFFYIRENLQRKERNKHLPPRLKSFTRAFLSINVRKKASIFAII